MKDKRVAPFMHMNESIFFFIKSFFFDMEITGRWIPYCLQLFCPTSPVARSDAGPTGIQEVAGLQHSFVEISHEIISIAILYLPLMQVEQLSAFGNRVGTTIMILSFRTDRPGQTVQTQMRLLLEQSDLIRVYTVCHSFCIVWTHYSMVERLSSNFKVITTNI